MKHALLALLLTIPVISEAAITAPASVDAGQLLVAKSDSPAVWTVYPVKYQTSFYVADEGSTLIFASPEKGEVTLIAATLKNEKIELSQHTLYNGVPSPNPSPVPDPKPEPDRTPLEEVLEGAKDYPAEDVNALADTFEAISSGIERGTITSPVSARESFRATWAANIAEVNPEAINTMSKLITAISEKIDNSSLEAIKRDYAIIARKLKEIKPRAEPPKPTTTQPNRGVYRQ